MKSLLSCWFRRSPSRPARSSRRFRPTLQALEGRELLATTIGGTTPPPPLVPGITYNPLVQQITIIGTDQADKAEVSIVKKKFGLNAFVQDVVVVSLGAYQYGQRGGLPTFVETFHFETQNPVNKVMFTGQGGNDIFSNFTPITVVAHGGDGNDTLATGNSLESKLYGEAGNDELIGGFAGDQLYGGIGNDTLTGAGGDDLLKGEAGFDVLNGGNGNDTLWGGSEDDTLHGGNDNDYLLGDSGVDIMFGDAGADTVSGGDGNDAIHGDSGPLQPLVDSANQLAGDGGDDWIDGAGAGDTIFGGTGNDTIFGNGGADVLSGDADNDAVYGGIDDDTLVGGGGNDQLCGQDGDDSVHGGLGQDTISGDDGNDTLYGDDGSDSVTGDFGDDSLFGGAGNDTLSGGSDEDSLYGGDDDDLLDGGDFNDTLYGEAGNDTLLGGDEYDHLFGGAGFDSLNGGGGAFDWLEAGSSAEPTSNGFNAYKPVVNLATYDDINQGSSDTCIFLSSLAAAAQAGANFENRISYVGNYHYQVSLFGPGSSTIVEDVYFDGFYCKDIYEPAFDGGWEFYDPLPVDDGESWTILFQRAYIQYLKNSGQIDQIGFDEALALHALTGQTVGSGNFDPQFIHDVLLAGGSVIADNADDDDSYPVVAQHAYMVKSVTWSANEGVWKVTLFNPWHRDNRKGATTTDDNPYDGLITMTWEQFADTYDFDGLYYAIP